MTGKFSSVHHQSPHLNVGAMSFLLPNQWKYGVKLRPSKALHSSVPDDRFEVGYMSNPQVVPHGSVVRNCLSTIYRLRIVDYIMLY